MSVVRIRIKLNLRASHQKKITGHSTPIHSLLRHHKWIDIIPRISKQLLDACSSKYFPRYLPLHLFLAQTGQCCFLKLRAGLSIYISLYFPPRKQENYIVPYVKKVPFFYIVFSDVFVSVCYLFFHGTVCVVVDLRLVLFGSGAISPEALISPLERFYPILATKISFM